MGRRSHTKPHRPETKPAWAEESQFPIRGSNPRPVCRSRAQCLSQCLSQWAPAPPSVMPVRGLQLSSPVACLANQNAVLGACFFPPNSALASCHYPAHFIRGFFSCVCGFFCFFLPVSVFPWGFLGCFCFSFFSQFQRRLL